MGISPYALEDFNVPDKWERSLTHFSPDFASTRLCVSLSLALMCDLFFILPKHIDMNIDKY